MKNMLKTLDTELKEDVYSGSDYLIKDADEWYNKGKTLYNERRYNDAILCFNSALILNPCHQLAKQIKEKSVKIMWGLPL